MRMNARKILAMITAMVAVLSLNTLAFAANSASDIMVYVNGEPVTFPDQSPVIESGRMLVPARTVFEGMGFDVAWESDEKTIVLTDDSVEVKIREGDSVFFVNDSVVVLDVPAKLIGGRMMLPLRAISEGIGANVASNDVLKLVSIFRI